MNGLAKFVSISVALQDPVRQTLFRFEGMVIKEFVHPMARRYVWEIGGHMYTAVSLERTGPVVDGLCPVLVTATRMA